MPIVERPIKMIDANPRRPLVHVMATRAVLSQERLDLLVENRVSRLRWLGEAKGRRLAGDQNQDRQRDPPEGGDKNDGTPLRREERKPWHRSLSLRGVTIRRDHFSQTLA
jgi:hypothetical protein